mgnify:CR=1 FL=1
MRGLLKILLLPLRLVLGIAIGVCRFFCICSTAVLSVMSSILFLLSLAVLLIGHVQTGTLGIVGAFLVSPLGLPKVAGWLIDRLDDLRAIMTAI